MIKDTMIGVDLAKIVFQIHVATMDGTVKFRKKLSRPQFQQFMFKKAPSVVAMEACGSANFWARELTCLGHDVKLISPRYVKPFVKRQKNDADDAERSSRRRSVRKCVLLTPKQKISKLGPVCTESGRDWSVSGQSW